MSNQPQHHAEAGFAKKAAILGICNLPYLAKDLRVEGGAFEEGYGAFASHNAQLVGIG